MGTYDNFAGYPLFPDDECYDFCEVCKRDIDHCECPLCDNCLSYDCLGDCQVGED